MGIRYGVSIRKGSHFEMNGIQVENVPLVTAHAARAAGGFESGFHNGDPVTQA